ncbi:hypothetical protein [Paenibacillus periandrae]|nr:hypothetical protein [Paenibacillus periandrae]
MVLGLLAGIDLPISRTAALMIVSHHEGEKEAIIWLANVGYEAKD